MQRKACITAETGMQCKACITAETGMQRKACITAEAQVFHSLITGHAK